MQCPFCKAFIDDDSIYCDQCGKEIFICPKCNKPGKGKMCIHDGTPLISMKEKIGSIHTDVKTSGTVSSANKKASEKSELCLINKNLGLYVDIFGQYQRISGKHLKINFDVQKGWLATDLGSTNGTKYNNVPLVPNQPQALGV